MDSRGGTTAAVVAQDRADQAAADADAGVQDPPWGETLNGLQYRLRTERSTWQSWQQPSSWSKFATRPSRRSRRRNCGSGCRPDRGTGLTLMRHPAPTLSEAELYGLEVRMRPDADAVPELKPGDTFRLPLAILATVPSRRRTDRRSDHRRFGTETAAGEPEFFPTSSPCGFCHRAFSRRRNSMRS